MFPGQRLRVKGTDCVTTLMPGLSLQKLFPSQYGDMQVTLNCSFPLGLDYRSPTNTYANGLVKQSTKQM